MCELLVLHLSGWVRPLINTAINLVDLASSFFETPASARISSVSGVAIAWSVGAGASLLYGQRLTNGHRWHRKGQSAQATA